jgi:hypothetical protein
VRGILPSFDVGDRLEPGWGIDSTAIVQPEIVLPEQLESIRGRTPEGPRALMLAVLEEAILCMRSAARSPRLGGPREAERARRWVRSRDRSWIFSFESVCAALEIDAESLRASLLGRAAAPARLPSGYRRHSVSRGLNRRVVAPSPPTARGARR